MPKTEQLLYLLLTVILCCMVGMVGYRSWTQVAAATDSLSDEVSSALLICNQPQHDFGDVVFALESSHMFRVKNNSQRPVRIVDIRSTCGCMVTRTQLRGATIAADEEINVPVLVNWVGKNGQVAAQITIQSEFLNVGTENSSRDNFLYLSVRGTVAPVLVAEPPSIDFGLIDGMIVRTLSVTRNDSRPIADMKIHATNPAVQAKVVSQSEICCVIELVADAKLFESGKRLDASLNVQVPDVIGLGGFLYVPLLGTTLDPNLRCFPSRLVFHRNRTRQQLTVEISQNLDHPIELNLSDNLKSCLTISRDGQDLGTKRRYWIDWAADESMFAIGESSRLGEFRVGHLGNVTTLPLLIVGHSSNPLEKK